MSILKQYNVNPKDWYRYGQWEQPVFSSVFWLYWHNEQICNKMGIGTLAGGLFMANGHTFVRTADVTLVREEIVQAIANRDLAYFDQILSVAEEIFAKHKPLLAELQSDAPPSVELFQRYTDWCVKMITPWWLSVLYSDIVGEILGETIKTHGLDAMTVFEAVPKPQTPMLEQYFDLGRIHASLAQADLLPLPSATVEAIEKIQSAKSVWSHVEQHLQTYEWMGTHHFWGEPMTIEKLIDDLRRYTPEEEQAAPPEFPEEIQFLIDVAARTGYFRQQCPDLFSHVAYAARPLLQWAGGQFGLTYDELISFSHTEVLAALKGGQSLVRDDVTARKDGFVLLLDDDQEVILAGSSGVNEIVETFLSESVQSGASECSGTIASPGVARGTGRIFLKPVDLEKMHEGDILFAPMTTPDFVPLMKKAAGIVTDIGGLLSHAAIVSRELGTPCIIGTGNATKIFQDGDTVEVDAEKGVVRKV